MLRRTIALASSLGLVLIFASSTALAQYQLTNLDSNQAALAPSNPPDPLLVNAWGMVLAHGGLATTIRGGQPFTRAPASGSLIRL